MPKIKLSNVRLESEEEHEKPPMNLVSYEIPVGMMAFGVMPVAHMPAYKYRVRNYVGLRDNGKEESFSMLQSLPEGTSFRLDYGGVLWNKINPIGQIYISGKAECIGSCKMLD